MAHFFKNAPSVLLLVTGIDASEPAKKLINYILEISSA